jgi:hypothetical protein
VPAAVLLGAIGPTFAPLFLATVLAGIVLSIAGWVAIRRSEGRLHGLPLAVLGTFVPPVLAVVLFLGMAVFLEIDAPVGPGGTREAPPWFDGRGGPEAAGVRVVGGTSLTPAGVVVAEQEALWLGITRSLEPNPDAKALRLAPADRDRHAAMSADQRAKALAIRRLGLAFFDVGAETGRTAERLRLTWVVLGPGGDGARIVRSDGEVTISYPVVREGGRWYPALGPVQVANRGPEAGDRVGWLDRVPGAPGDPAERVSGGPTGTSELDRAVSAHVVTTSWRGGQSERASPSRPHEYRGMGLYHLVLDSTGETARVVMTDGRLTVATSFRFTGPFTGFVGPEQAELRIGPAVPEDRNGHLDDEPDAHAAAAADAALVRGGPIGWSPGERTAVARAIRNLWAERGPEFVRRPVEVRVGESRIPWSVGGPASEFRLYAVALEEDARSGRAVLTNDRTTLAIGVARDGDDWVLTEQDWEQRVGPAVDEYRDGRLYR